jgi:hypothetical protein
MGMKPEWIPHVLILGTAEWNSPIATNQHYVVRELAKMADVTFVESLGLRRPALRRDDVVRMTARAKRAFGAATPTAAGRPKPDRARIVSPLVVPVHRAPTRALNRTLLRKATADWLTGPRPRVLWAFTPVTYGLEAEADAVIYHCVDLLATFPGVDGHAVNIGERGLSGKVGVAIATSQAVADHLAGQGFQQIRLLPNVADISVFSAASRPLNERLPQVLFSGNLTASKLDVALLADVARALRGRGELLLAGPLAAGGGDFTAPLRELEACGARYLGILSPQELASVAGTCSVGLIPYVLNDYTYGVSPLKCYEYLASGLSVISTPMPAVTEIALSNPHVSTATAADFVNRVLAQLAPASDSTITSRVTSAAGHSWDERGQTLRELLTAQIARGRT